jgi:hypothetical protein
MLAQREEISQRQQKSRPWLALISATLALFCLTTLSFICVIYDTLIQTQSYMLSSDTNLDNRVIWYQHKYRAIESVDLLAGNMSVCVHECPSQIPD